jgi:hypothetical protein
MIRRAVIPSAYSPLASHRRRTSKVKAIAKMIDHLYEHGKVNFKYMSEPLLHVESSKMFPRVWMDDSAARFATLLRMCPERKVLKFIVLIQKRVLESSAAAATTY